MSVLQYLLSFPSQVKSHLSQNNRFSPRCQVKTEGIFGFKPLQGNAEYGVTGINKGSCTILEESAYKNCH